MDKKIIVSESERPFWQLIIAAALFTVSFLILIAPMFYSTSEFDALQFAKLNFDSSLWMLTFAIMFCFKKTVHLDLNEMRFRPTFEIGPIRLGIWKHIPNPNYVSVFNRLKANGDYKVEVRIWYDKNKHLEVYEKNDLREAFFMAYDIASHLNIKLLDSTIPNKKQWIEIEHEDYSPKA